MAHDFRFGGDADDKTVARSLELNGIAVLDEFLDGRETRELANEVSSLFRQREKGDLSFDKSSSVKRLFDDSMRACLSSRPRLRELSTSRLAQFVCDDFFGAGRWSLGAIYAMRYVDRMPTNDKFHIDPSATVKFFFYLSDVAADAGPFTFCVGSHREGFFRMRAAALAGTPGGKQIPDAEVRSATPIEGKAGTLIVFNSIGIHRAGNITPGNERHTVTLHYAAHYERSLRKRILRRLRGTASVEYLCAYAAKHQSLSTAYEE